jgi:hypothetical protein
MCQFSQVGRQALASQICHLSVNAAVLFGRKVGVCGLVDVVLLFRSCMQVGYSPADYHGTR